MATLKVVKADSVPAGASPKAGYGDKAGGGIVPPSLGEDPQSRLGRAKSQQSQENIEVTSSSNQSGSRLKGGPDQVDGTREGVVVVMRPLKAADGDQDEAETTRKSSKWESGSATVAASVHSRVKPSKAPVMA